MYKVRVYNDHQVRAMLEREDMDLTKFYKNELISFLEVSIKDCKKYKELFEEERKKTNKALSWITLYRMDCDNKVELVRDLKQFEDILLGVDNE